MLFAFYVRIIHEWDRGPFRVLFRDLPASLRRVPISQRVQQVPAGLSGQEANRFPQVPQVAKDGHCILLISLDFLAA
jgi:hypothetical protein